jgi:hypothetical protein
MQPFAILTSDTDWIARNHATPSPKGDGRVIVQVPAEYVARHTFAGTEMLRVTFADVPADAINAAISCPAAWVEG